MANAKVSQQGHFDLTAYWVRRLPLSLGKRRDFQLVELLKNLAAFFQTEGQEKLEGLGIDRQSVIHLESQSFHLLMKLRRGFKADPFTPKKSLVGFPQLDAQRPITSIAFDSEIRREENAFLIGR